MARASLETTSKSFPGFIYTNVGLVQDTLTIYTTGVSDGYEAGTVIAYDESHYVKYATTDVDDEVLATGDGSTKTFTGFLANKRAVPGTVVITATVGGESVEIADDEHGMLSGTGVSGYIDYDSGYYYLVFGTAPDNTENITADYTYANGWCVGILLEDVPGDNASYPARVMVAGVVDGSKLEPSADRRIKGDLKHIVFV